MIFRSRYTKEKHLMTRLVAVLVFALTATTAPIAARAQNVPRFQCSGVTSPVSVVNFSCGGCSVSGGTMTVPCGSGGAGTVTSISQGTGITMTPNPTTTTGTVAVNQAFSPTWTGNHAWSPGGIPLVDFGVTVPGVIALQADTLLAALPGTGGLALDGMTGDSTFPTGGFRWIGDSGKLGTLTAVGAALNLTGGATSVFTTSAGNLQVDAAAALTLAASTATSVELGRAGIRNLCAGMINQTVGADLTVTGNAIAITTNIHKVGAGLIKNITVPATLTSGAVVQIIPTAAFTYDGTGNIQPPPGGAATATINRVMTFVYAGGQWFPSY